MLDTASEIVYLVGFAAGCVIRGIYTRGRTKRRTADRRRTPLDTALVALAGAGLVVAPLVFLATPWLDFADYPPPGWTVWPGAAVFAAAILLLWRSHADLGRHWSPTLEIRDDHALVTTGLYRHIRHPMYTAHGLWGLAQLLLLPNWIAGPAMLVFFIPLCMLRIPREEQMLLDHFGEAYRRYMGRTGRLLPPLRRRVGP